MAASRKLVIVESPAKARTIAAFLGDEYQVEASVGHIRDLPQPSELPADLKKGPLGKFAVDVENGFTPYYVVDADKKKKVAELKRLLREADELYLATDEDREGEAIAWHLLEVLAPKVPVKRMVFHEITPAAITRALVATRDINKGLVDAQETRRILDRLYGYEVSPVLWRKVRQGLSAGRVQSVATRLVVERERERMAFTAAQYWDLSAKFDTEVSGDKPFEARLFEVDGRKIASGRDFSDDGALRDPKLLHLGETEASALRAGLEKADFTVTEISSKPYSRRPAAPFTTSTLQQEASRKLRLSARQTMRTAQSLYENGYITYMRTDSSALSSQAVSAARKQATALYGADSIPDKPRMYASKSKGAQEAHEAIRPAGDVFRTPKELSGELNSEQLKLYELIWKRTVASQMADAKGHTASVKIAGTTTDSAQRAVFSAAGTVITFRGFLAAYEESQDADRYGDSEKTDQVRLPELTQNQRLRTAELAAKDHTTNPPPRFTEASLVDALEKRGIGRPSTYAATISTILDRGYVSTRGQALVPTWLAFAVTKLLEKNFATLVDYDFTAAMEADLDEIAAGDRVREQWLSDFYFGSRGKKNADGTAVAGYDLADGGLRGLVENLGEIDAKEVNSIPIGEQVVLRVGRYGPYLENSAVGEGEPGFRASVPEDLAPDELTLERALEILATTPDGDIELGVDPVSGHQIVARNGRYGPYVTEVLPEEPEDEVPAGAKKTKKKAAPKPRTASLFKTMTLDSVTLEDALKLLSLPRVVGVDPESNEEITAQNGRFGPYLKKGTDSRTLSSEEQLLDITLEQALEIYAQPKRGRGASATPPLAEFGLDPESGKKVVVKDGRFGPYITDGTTNRTVPRDVPIAELTEEQAFSLLAEKRAAGPAKRTTRKPAAKRASSGAAAAKATGTKTVRARKPKAES